ncbi:MAG: metal ABC transporter ATP-binding protein [Flammeovirgaceae bacterium]|nr:metal ABC transporter ATP-binding protein [Flammeovirgaceae bacterium]
MIAKIENPVIECHDITVVYHNKPAIWNITYGLPKGELIGIIGPNGSGKTTMLKTIMGLVKPTSGYVRIFGQDLEKVRQRVAYVPQRTSVDWDFPASVFDVVLMGRYTPKKIFRRSTKHDKEVAMECIHKVQLEKVAHRQIAQLSGGQQQRVFIARALAQEAELYLLDEPFAGVDAVTENAIISLLKDMKKQGKTILVVHHDLQTVSEYFDWLVLIHTRLIASGKTTDVFVPNLLQETFGGKLPILSQVSELLKQNEHPVREKK